MYVGLLSSPLFNEISMRRAVLHLLACFQKVLHLLFGYFFLLYSGSTNKKVYTVGDVYLALNVERAYQLKKLKGE